MPSGQEEAGRAFYVEILGFSEVPKPIELAGRGGLWFRSGQVVLHLGVDAHFVPAKKAHPALRCNRYNATIERLDANDITAIEDEHPFEGSRHCYIADPFGNRIELIDEE